MSSSIAIKKTVWIVCMLVIAGCKEKVALKQNYQEIKVLNDFKLSKITDSLLKEYIKIFPKEPAYAIFIDKKRGTQEYMLTIAAFSAAVTNMYESGAINYFMLTDTTPVFLYTGLEDFIVSDTPLFAKTKEKPKDLRADGEFKDFDPINLQIDFTNSWSYVHLDTVSYIIKGNSHPFTGDLIIKPAVQFKPPEKNY